MYINERNLKYDFVYLFSATMFQISRYIIKYSNTIITIAMRDLCLEITWVMR